MTTFFISDTHFGHKAILQFENIARPFPTIEEMNETIIQNWNANVSKHDVVYHLGDVLFGASNYNLLSRLKGIKKLVLGNHDNPNIMAKYFNTLYGVGSFEGYTLTHIPIHPSQFYRFKGNIHGHLHSDVVTTDGRHPDPLYANVSCEQIGLTPISWDELKKRL